MHIRQWLVRYRRILLLSGAALAAVVVLSLIDHRCNPTGFGRCPLPENIRPEKTLWDWLDLLVVPAVLVGVGLFYNRTEKQTELTVADQRGQDAILQTYFDQMGDLLLNHNPRQSPNTKVVRDLARVRTLTTLRRLDVSRRNMLIQFLRDADLVNSADFDSPIDAESIIDFRNANLSRADLREIYFKYFHLENAKLKRVHLEEAYLKGAHLEHAILKYAHLEGAVLIQAHLEHADLRRAHLEHANLCEAHLEGADLSGARLDYADLRASTITAHQLAQALSYTGAQLPDHLRSI